MKFNNYFSVYSIFPGDIVKVAEEMFRLGFADKIELDNFPSWAPKEKDGIKALFAIGVKNKTVHDYMLKTTVELIPKSKMN